MSQPEQPIVKLTWFELKLAAEVGVLRNVESYKKGLPDKHYTAKENWSTHILGASCELALAKILGIYWDGSVNVFKVPDVGPYHVRGTYQTQYDPLMNGLKLWEKDWKFSTEPFVLVHQVKEGVFQVMGWITPEMVWETAHQKHFQKAVCRLVSVSDLQPLSTLLLRKAV
jgi:hypothetical protein